MEHLQIQGSTEMARDVQSLRAEQATLRTQVETKDQELASAQRAVVQSQGETERARHVAAEFASTARSAA